MAAELERLQMVNNLHDRLKAVGISPADVASFTGKVEKTFGIEQQKRIYDALGLMAEVHNGQTRPDNTPYFYHPLRVAGNVADNMQHTTAEEDADRIITGLLHDSVEDKAAEVVKRLTPKRALRRNVGAQALKAIGTRFGPGVEKLVAALTNPDFKAKLVGIEEPRATELKNEMYVNHVAEAIQDPDVAQIKYEDFKENGFKLDELPDGPKKAKLLIKYTPLLGIFKARAESSLPMHVTDAYRKQMPIELEAKMREYEEVRQRLTLQGLFR